MPESLVSVVVPSYNRAFLLARTLPSYLQEGVGELLLVDDCSTDETEAVVGRLAAGEPRIRYLRSERNLKQTHAKNLGISAARFPLVYFGDDDSILLPGSVKRLLATMRERDADIVGARAPYMERAEDEADPEAFAARALPLEGPLVEPLSLHAHFDRVTPEAVEAPFVHAAFLTRRELAARIRFDEGYDGNCYREETDFLVRAGAAGARIWYEPKAVQANLPRESAGGGAQGKGKFLLRKLRYFASVLKNNRRFLIKNQKELDLVLGRSYPPVVRQLSMLWDISRVIVTYPVRAAARHVA